jgi:hypothetical protein
VVLVLFAFGMCLNFWGDLVDDSYWSSVLANGGVAVFLAVPLVLAERARPGRSRRFVRRTSRELGTIRHENDRAMGVLGSRLEDVQATVANVSEQLAHVTERTASAVAEEIAAEDAAMRAPARAVAAAHQDGEVDSNGVRPLLHGRGAAHAFGQSPA